VGDDKYFFETYSGVRNIRLINGNTALAGVNTSSVVGYEGFGGLTTEIAVIKGAGAIPTTVMPVFAFKERTEEFLDQDVTLMIIRDDSVAEWEAVEDNGANGRTLSYNAGGPTAFSLIHYDENGVTIESFNGAFTSDDDFELMTFTSMREGHHIGLSITADSRSAPTTNTYTYSGIAVVAISEQQNSPLNAGRIIDIVRSPSSDTSHIESFFVDGVIAGLNEVRKINEYLDATNASGSIISAVNSYYTTIKKAGDTLATIPVSALHLPWWLNKSNGVTPNTKGKLYEMWYATCRDQLNLARANVEFAEFVLNG
jgi:hypothetical protein